MPAPDASAPADPGFRPPARRPFPRLRGLRAAAVLLIAFGAGGLLVRFAEGPRRIVVETLAPGPIASMKDGAAAVKGRVAEIYGDKFVLADDTGRALVETGPAGRSGLVQAGETVTAQGRFDHGSLHAAVLTHADGRRDALDPGPGGPPPPPRGPDMGP